MIIIITNLVINIISINITMITISIFVIILIILLHLGWSHSVKLVKTVSAAKKN